MNPPKKDPPASTEPPPLEVVPVDPTPTPKVAMSVMYQHGEHAMKATISEVHDDGTVTLAVRHEGWSSFEARGVRYSKTPKDQHWSLP